MKKIKSLQKLFFALMSIGIIWHSTANAQKQVFPSPSTNGAVYTISEDSTNVYVGGSFSQAGTGLFSNALTDTSVNSNFNFDSLSIKVNGEVNVVISDGAGGYYVGGSFTAGGKQNLIRVNSSKAIIATFTPNPNGAVYDLKLVGNRLYVCGAFTIMSGVTRRYIAAINKSTSAALPTDPNLNNAAYDLKLIGDTLYFGGSFTTVGTTQQSGIGALIASTGANVTINSIDGPVYSIAADTINKELYFGGYFNSIGQNKRGCAKISSTTGLSNPSFPGVVGTIYTCITDSNGGWYIGGSFSSTVGASNLAHITSGNVIDAAFKPNPNSTVYALALTGSKLYAGGSFTSIGGQARLRLVQLNKTSGVVQTWDPGCDGTIYSLTLNDTLIYATGQFNTVNAVTVLNYAAINVANSKVYRSVGTNGIVRTSIQDANNLYLGGAFSLIGKPTAGIASYTTTNSNPNLNFYGINGTINAIISDGGTGWYVGGYFTAPNGYTHLVHILASGAVDAAFDPNPNYTVNCLLLNGNNLYVGGSFNQIDLQARSYIAAVNKATGH
nr:hypothetical protein [Bacteroidota bacterium]